jgi:hypothetical protein
MMHLWVYTPKELKIRSQRDICGSLLILFIYLFVCLF